MINAYDVRDVGGNNLLDIDGNQIRLLLDIEDTTIINFGQIKDKIWNLLSQRAGTSTVFSDTIIGDEINQTIREICKGRVINKLTKKEYRAGRLWFLEGKVNLRNKSGSELSQNLTVGDSFVYCNTTFLLTSGFVEIGGDIISYSGIGTDSIGTYIIINNGLTIDHLATEKIIQLYEIPVECDKIYKVNKIIQTNGLRKIEIPPDDTTSFTYYYNIYRYETRQLIKIVGFQDNDLIEVIYYKGFDDMVNSFDTCVLPNDYGLSIVAYLVSGALGYNKGMINGERNLNTGYDKLQEMYQYFTNQTIVIKQKLNTTPYGFNSIRR